MAERFSKGPIVPTFKRFRWFPLATPEKYGGSYLKNAIMDAPNFVICLGMGACAIGALAYMVYQDSKNPRFHDRPYKRHYTVWRPDDPRIQNLKNRPDYYNPEGTIPDPLDTKPEYSGWIGKKPYPVMEDGRYANDLSLINMFQKKKPMEWAEKE